MRTNYLVAANSKAESSLASFSVVTDVLMEEIMTVAPWPDLYMLERSVVIDHHSPELTVTQPPVLSFVFSAAETRSQQI